MTLEATIVTKACLPKVLPILMDLELVPSRAIDYLQDIQVARPVGLPSALATLPSRVKGNGAWWSTLEPIKVLEA